MDGLVVLRVSPGFKKVHGKPTLRYLILFFIILGLSEFACAFNVERDGDHEKFEAPKRNSIVDIECKGPYDKWIYSKLETICEDCYNLYREPGLHSACSQNCYSSQYFLECLDVLTLSDDVEKYKGWIRQVYAPDLDDADELSDDIDNDKMADNEPHYDEEKIIESGLYPNPLKPDEESPDSDSGANLVKFDQSKYVKPYDYSDTDHDELVNRKLSHEHEHEHEHHQEKKPHHGFIDHHQFNPANIHHQEELYQGQKEIF